VQVDRTTIKYKAAARKIRGAFFYLSGVVASSSAARIRNVRRKYIGAYIVSVEAVPVFSCESVLAALASVAASDATSFTVVFVPDRYIPVIFSNHTSTRAPVPRSFMSLFHTISSCL
jgi:hypothetical protein